MAQKKKENALNKSVSNASNDIQVFSPKTEKIYKAILRTMSWVVGVCFLSVIVLPVFEYISLDPITMLAYRIGAITLIAFTIIEFVADYVKNLIEKSFNG